MHRQVAISCIGLQFQTLLFTLLSACPFCSGNAPGNAGNADCPATGDAGDPLSAGFFGFGGGGGAFLSTIDMLWVCRWPDGTRCPVGAGAGAGDVDESPARAREISDVKLGYFGVG
ncbi:hypothetical protein V1517DRAFT_47201 [Lipomyces orientalis]|uniref:Uncharacterized protein n=1 Tax=Lipomyces orientalis TaxID=1233043 RepID=A0ACC3TEZ6_9ASCO